MKYNFRQHSDGVKKVDQAIKDVEYYRQVRDVCQKKQRENVGIFPKSGTPPLPPVWEFFPDFTVYFWEVSHVKKSKKWKWDSGRTPVFSKFPHFPVVFFGNVP